VRSTVSAYQATPAVRPARRTGSGWVALAAVEVVIATAVVVRDVLVPTIVILVLAAASLAVRRERLATLGFHRLERPFVVAGKVLALTAAWALFELALIMPILNHVTGRRQDLSDFADLRGNVPSLLVFLALTWTIAAIGEELVYRGYLQTRITDVLGADRTGVVAAVLFSSVLFGLAHTEQGVIGVVVTFCDAIFFSLVRMHFGRNLWASVFAHGMNNTLGLVAFFVVGPIYGFW
jgi:CAAX protease family protein